MQELREAQRLDAALSLAYRRIARRDRTSAEIEQLLRERDVDELTLAATIDELTELGYLDDARYAVRFTSDRRLLDGWGSVRIERRLRELGVARELIAAALERRDDEQSELDAAVEQLRRRFPEPPRTARDQRRAVEMLMRRGYGRELAHDALRRLEAGDC